MNETNENIFIVPSIIPSIYSNNALSNGISFEATTYYQLQLKEYEKEARENKESEENTGNQNENDNSNNHQASSNRNVETERNYWYGVYGVIVLFACILSSLIVILIPQHNVIKQPEYWYELMFIFLFGYWGFLVINITLVCAKVLHYQELKSFSIMVDLFVTACIAQVSIYTFVYIVWSHYFEYNHPMPFSGSITSYLVYPLIIIRLWYKFPKHVRRTPIFGSRLQA